MKKTTIKSIAEKSENSHELNTSVLPVQLFVAYETVFTKNIESLVEFPTVEILVSQEDISPFTFGVPTIMFLFSI